MLNITLYIVLGLTAGTLSGLLGVRARRFMSFACVRTCIAAVIALLLAGCASVSVKIPVRHSAGIDVGNIKRIAVVDFRDASMAPGSGMKVATTLMSMLLDEGYYQVVERDRMRQILGEQKLAIEGIVDESDAVEIGKMLGVGALIFGEVSGYSVETVRGWENVEEQVGTGKYEMVERKNIFTGKKYKVKEEIMKTVLVRRQYVVKKAGVDINFRMVHVETGEVLAVESIPASYSKKAVSSYEVERLPADQSILSDLTRVVTGKFARKISPYTATEVRALEKGKDKLTKEGVIFAREGLWDRAIERWEDALKASPSNASACYNLGVAYEHEGKLQLAKEHYGAAVDLNPRNKTYMRSLKSVHDRLRMLEK